MEIRNANSSDYSAIKRINQQVYKCLTMQRPDLFKSTETSSIKRQYYEMLLFSQNHYIIVAEQHDQIIGYSIFQLKKTPYESLMKERTYLVILQIAVFEVYQRQGVGKKLIKYIEEIAKHLGAKAIELNVFSYNKKAIEFYKDFGMEIQSCKFEKRIRN